MVVNIRAKSTDKNSFLQDKDNYISSMGLFTKVAGRTEWCMEKVPTNGKTAQSMMATIPITKNKDKELLFILPAKNMSECGQMENKTAMVKYSVRMANSRKRDNGKTENIKPIPKCLCKNKLTVISMLTSFKHDLMFFIRSECLRIIRI